VKLTRKAALALLDNSIAGTVQGSAGQNSK
jgi:hypothetical protein